MKFLSTSLPGVWLIELDTKRDQRGFFVRTYCADEFKAQGLNTHWPQCNLTLTATRGMIRGLHFQADPKPETKLIRCDSGAIFDVLVDVRKNSATFGKWEVFTLNASTHRMLYVPGGFAHGFECLEDNCRVFYQMSDTFDPSLARGVRWNDPQLKIPWPIPDPVVSERDQNLPFLRDA